MSTIETDAPTETTRKLATAQAWVKQARHNVVLPSGAVVAIRIPDLNALIASGEIPQHLLSEATSQADAAEKKKSSFLTKEEAERELEFKNFMVAQTVVEPKVTPAMLAPGTGIPTEDKDMIVEFALRSREFDTEGNHISGLHTSEQFRKFRGVDSLYQDVEGVPGS